MLPSATALSTQQLAEFLAVISVVPDGDVAAAVAAEGAARALEAEVGVVLGRNGVLSAVGFPRGRVPVDELIEVVTGRRRLLDVPGAGRCHTAVAPIGGPVPGHLLVARQGDDGFTVDEVSLLRGMARVLELTVARLHTLVAERRQAAENERLLAELRERHRLLQELSKIQRAIARQEPFPAILDAITVGAQQLLGDEVAGLRLRDPDDPSMVILHAGRGWEPDAARALWRVCVADAGAAGQAVIRDDVVVVQHPPVPAREPEGSAVPAPRRIRAEMAAPVHDNGLVVGSLMVGSYRTRCYTDRDREVLRVFADHVSLAVTDHQTREKMYAAYHDPLTGLASRALFLDRLGHDLARAVHQNTRLAVLFVDLDRFKMVNDSLGHAGGDALLVGVADRLRLCLRGPDTAARLGGDEFAVVLQNLDGLGQAAAVAGQIITALQAPFVIQDREVFVNASIGVAANTDAAATAEDLIRDADLAMYQAKKNGKGRYEIYEPSMQARLMRTVNLETDLRRALERDEFILHYQPIVDLADGRVHAVEALVRWQHPDRGLVAPQMFVALAEETGLIVPIGLWVLREACRQAAAWNTARPGEPPLTVSVNLSARQFQQPDLPAVLAGTLSEMGLDPSCLVLEITESLLLHDTDVTLSRLRQIKALGLRLAIDDFGTGYSSLAYLRSFPIDIIKIDKSFVAEIAQGAYESSALARAIVQLGRTLRMVTLAEGIETAEQAAELYDVGCQLGQGYHFAAPLEPHRVTELLSAPELPWQAPVAR
jgi:diguanylate cyclase (GGDEF)-like protein